MNTNTNSIESSEIEISQNVYKQETDQDNNNENESNNEIKTSSYNMNKTNEAFTSMDGINRDGDKLNTNEAKKDYVVYGYYVREPIWVNMEVGTGGGGGGVSYDPASRNSFICLVFLIVFTMLVFTTGYGIMCMRLEFIQDIYSSRFGLFMVFVAVGVMVAMSYAMACSRCTRVIPCNIICLVIATLAMSVIVGYMVVRFEPVLVTFAVIATTAVVFVCFLLAFTSFDFTKWLLYVIVISVVLAVLFMCVMMATLITGESFPIIALVLLVVSTLVHAVMLTIEIQMILGGRSIELEEDDYAYGAFMIYTSVIDLFLKIIQCMGILDYIL